MKKRRNNRQYFNFTLLIGFVLFLLLTIIFVQKKENYPEYVQAASNSIGVTVTQTTTPSFRCLGSCPTLPVTQIPANTDTPTQVIPTSNHLPNHQPRNMGGMNMNGMNMDGMNTAAYNTVDTTVDQTHIGNGNLLDQLIDLILQLINLLLGTTPPVIIPPPPTPTVYPVSPTPVATSSAGLISVDSLKYVPGNEPTDSYNFIAEQVGNEYTFNGIVPGPQLVVHLGDHVHVNVLNNLPVSITIHWHGLAVPNSADGVPGVTQNAIQPGQTYAYDFVANEAGTFWYHTHQNALDTLPKGLYGALIILPTTNPNPTDLDYTAMYRNIQASQSGALTNIQTTPGETVRLRIIDVRNGDFSGAPVTAALIGAPYKIVALDGRDINQPQTIQNELLPIQIAQRYDLEFTMPTSGSVELVESDQDLASDNQAWTFGTGPVNNTPANINTLPMFSFLNYGVHETDTSLPPDGVFDQNFVMNIGENLSINGQLYPNVPDLVVTQGQYVHIKIVNNSDMWHAMHIHGGYFTVIDENGIPVTGSPIHLDTILVNPFDTDDIVMYENNPGIWMFHCHILPHAAAGLMMMIRYANVYTPYSASPGSGNIPE